MIKVIAKANDKITKIWGKQKLDAVDYRVMQYTIPIEVDEGLLLHNVMTGELVLLDPETSKLIEQLPGKIPCELEKLVEKHFLVEVSYDEHKTMQQLRSVLQTMENDEDITNYVILPTTYCNAKCFYCYESNYEHVHMSENTAKELVDFIEKHHGNKGITIEWFGGEPLVGSKRIDQICASLKEKGIAFDSVMITNGYLFDREMVGKAKSDWNLKSLQITLDGTEKVYNKVKSYKEVTDNPFLRVLHNIALLLDTGIYVSVRMNMDRYNYTDLYQLIDVLKERFGSRKNFSANIAILFDDCGFEPVKHTDEDYYQLNEWLELLNARLKEYGLRRSKNDLPQLHIRQCIADHNNSMVVTPEGELHKCEHYLYETTVGNINNDAIDKRAVDELRYKTIDYSECKGCVLQPKCYHLTICNKHNLCNQHPEREIQEEKRKILKFYKMYIHDANHINNDCKSVC